MAGRSPRPPDRLTSRSRSTACGRRHPLGRERLTPTDGQSAARIATRAGPITAIKVLSQPTHRISVIAYPTRDQKRGVRIVSGFRDGHAVIASQNTAPDDPGGSIRITSATLANWVTALVSALPPAGPGRLPPVPDLTGDHQSESVLIGATPDPVDEARRILPSARTDLLGEFMLEQLVRETTTVLSRATVLVAELSGDGRYAIYGRTTKASMPVTPGALAKLLTDILSDLKHHVKA